MTTSAKWAWTLEDDSGEFIASMAIVPDGPRRGWFVSYPGEALTRAPQLRPLVRHFRIFLDCGNLYDELRSWVLSDDPRANRFAEWFGFELDCGPAAGYSPTGQDMNLYLWKRE